MPYGVHRSPSPARDRRRNGTWDDRVRRRSRSVSRSPPRGDPAGHRRTGPAKSRSVCADRLPPMQRPTAQYVGVCSDASTLRPVGDPPPRSRSPDVRRGYRHDNHPPVSGHHPVAKRSPSPLPWRRHRSRSRTPPPHSRSDGRLPGAMVASRLSPPPHWRRSDRQGLPETYYEKCVHGLVMVRGVPVHVCLPVPPSVSLSLRLSPCPSVCLPVPPSVSLSLRLSPCP